MKFEILNKERIFDEFFKIDKAQVKHERFNGKSWNQVTRYGLQRPEAVAVLLENTSKNTVIMVEQFRYATVNLTDRDGWMLEIVAGMIDNGETPEQSAKRETLEEVGYKITHLDHLYSYFASIGISDERVHIYHAEVKEEDKISEGGGLKTENEDLAIREIPFLELFDLIKNGKIVDSKTIIASQWLAIKKGVSLV